MKITSKGQVTIPQDIRERTGLMSGCEVEFVEDRDGRVSIRKAGGASRGRRIIEGLRGRGAVRMTTDEILKLTRDERRIQTSFPSLRLVSPRQR